MTKNKKKIRPLSPPELPIKNKIKRYLEEKEYIFVIGSNAMGKTPIILTALKEIKSKKSIPYYHFDFREQEFEVTADSFYKQILDKIGVKNFSGQWENDISNEFIHYLDKTVKNPIILFFDTFSLTHHDFYDNFSRDCRKIYDEGLAYPGSGLSNILMIFAGSTINQNYAATASPLWNILRKVQVLPLPIESATEIIKFYFNSEMNLIAPSKNEINFVYDLTQGYPYLMKSVIRFITWKQYDLNRLKKKEAAREFVNYIFQLFEKHLEVTEKEKKLKLHFTWIVEFLEGSPNLFETVMAIKNGKIVNGLPFPEMDELTITGLLKKDKDGVYIFSNDIYQNFLERFLDDHRAADFCILHSKDSEFWDKARITYKTIHKRKKPREANAILSPSDRTFNDLTEKLLEHLHMAMDSDAIVNELGEMLHLVFGVSSWNIHHIKKEIDVSGKTKKIMGEHDDVFSGQYHEESPISKQDLNHLSRFTEKALKTKRHMIDWTGRWIAIPLLIREDFEHLFIARLESCPQNMQRPLVSYIQEAVTIYFYQWSKENVQKELKKLQKTQKITFGEIYREGLQPVWELSKHVLKQFGIEQFWLHEILADKQVVFTTNNEKNIIVDYTERKISEIPELASIMQEIKNNENNIVQNGNTHYWGKPIDSKNLVVIEFKSDSSEIKNKKKNLLDIFKLFVLAIDYHDQLKKAEQDRYLREKMLFSSQELMYLVDKSYNTIFKNDKMKKMIQDESRDFKTCHELLFDSPKTCDDCLIPKVFDTKEIQPSIKRIVFNQKEYTMDTSYVPIIEKTGGQIVAVAVYMHDITDRQVLWESIEKLEQKEKIEDREKIIFNALKSFGFQRVFQFRADSQKQGAFISENYFGDVFKKDKGYAFKKGHIKFSPQDEDLLQGRVIVWRRKKTTAQLKRTLDDRLSGSNFSFKESSKFPAFDSALPNRPDFWLTIPIMGKEGIVKLYVLDNRIDNEKNDELVTIEKLQIFETFGRTVGQILDNARQRDYLKRFQAMLSHGTMEPLQLMRLYLDNLIDQDDKRLRKISVQKADVNLGMVQAALGGLLTVERGHQRISKKNEDIDEFLSEQMELFRTYAEKTAGIQFDLYLPKNGVSWNTDKTVLLQIVNNIVGNSIRHLQRLKKEHKKIKMIVRKKSGKLQIIISDNGEGLPIDIKSFLKKEFEFGLPFPRGGLGIGLSREMADMMGGRFELLDEPNHSEGTTYCLTLS